MLSSFRSIVLTLFHLITISDAFWFYGYDRVFRDPYPETYNNEIVQTSVITYLASSRNVEIEGIAKPYSYKLILFESIIQTETNHADNAWNIGVWESFIYCDENEDTLCLYFSDGEYCDNGYFRETSIELTCSYDSDEAVLFDINEYEECVYSAKLYFPQLCASQGHNTIFVRDPTAIDKIKASSYISQKGNVINSLSYTVLSGVHNVGISMVVNEIEDIISISMHGPIDKYYAIGFGSNGMLNTYAIVVDNNDGIYFEQLLDSHASGYTLSASFILEEHLTFAEENMHKITISRKLSSAVELDLYWIFSCVDDYIDVIWSVGESKTFAKHVAFGEDRLYYKVNIVEGYDRSQIINNFDGEQFDLKINWSTIFVTTCTGFVLCFLVKRYRENAQNVARGSALNATHSDTVHNEYGSVANQHDTEPLIQK